MGMSSRRVLDVLDVRNAGSRRRSPLILNPWSKPIGPGAREGGHQVWELSGLQQLKVVIRGFFHKTQQLKKQFYTKTL